MKENIFSLEAYINTGEDRILQLENKLKQLSSQSEIHLFGPLFKTDDFKLKIPQTEIVILIDTLLPQFNNNSLLLGDADSTPANSEIFFDYLFPQKKDFTDFEAALALLLNFSKHDHQQLLHFHGFWGGRFDHAHLVPCQINDYLLQQLSKTQVVLYDSNNLPILKIFNQGKHIFHEQISFSLITAYKQKIILEGDLEYKGEVELAAWSGHGLSNKSHGKWTLECSLPIWKYLLSNDLKNHNQK